MRESAVSHYRNNLRDIEFTLFEVFGSDALLGREPFGDVDSATTRETLERSTGWPVKTWRRPSRQPTSTRP